MIRWIKRATAVWSGLFLVALFYSHTEVAIIGGILNLAWVLDEKFPPILSRFVGPSILVINTVLSAYGAVKGAPAILVMLVVAGSLFSWNAELFLNRWGDAPLTVQRRYLQRVCAIVALGLGTGLSALALQGSFSLHFLSAFLVMLTAGVLWLRIVSETSKKDRAG